PVVSTCRIPCRMNTENERVEVDLPEIPLDAHCVERPTRVVVDGLTRIRRKAVVYAVAYQKLRANCDGLSAEGHFQRRAAWMGKLNVGFFQTEDRKGSRPALSIER